MDAIFISTNVLYAASVDKWQSRAEITTLIKSIKSIHATDWKTDSDNISDSIQSSVFILSIK